KLDFPLLLELFSARPDWHLVLIGEEREGQSNPDLARLGALPNVYRLGYRPYADLPAYLRGIQVGLLPSALNAYTRAMFPMKFYEFLAAGIPVAATPLAFAAEPHPGLAVGAGPAGFAAAIARQLARGRLTRQETLVAVGENTWGKRLDRMLALAGLESAGRDEAAS
ncbi:MAG: glycosyltransferase, partial [Cucumibacter sp.]